ncbi:MAG: hypothetical protein VYA30_09260 [Myxococcota bacterium]|nr:hypothetical protein [Myxococcota bacterium]
MKFIFALVVMIGSAQANPSIHGIALGLYYKGDVDTARYHEMIDEIAETGATHISIITLWSMRDIRASTITPHPLETPSDALVTQVIAHAKKRGLRVMLFPILWIETRGDGEWRGKLAPKDVPKWWISYEAFITHFARLAQKTGADIFSIGSELSSMERFKNRWTHIAKKVRGVYSGQLIYSANWDHYEDVPFWSAVDLVGLTGYYRLTEKMDPTVADLIRSWRPIKASLLAWSKRLDKPFVFTEVGYPSLDGAAHSPWDYTTGKKLDLEEQRICYEAFRLSWQNETRLQGVFFWNWWGPKDGLNHWYTPRGKPALGEIQKWMKDQRRK